MYFVKKTIQKVYQDFFLKTYYTTQSSVYYTYKINFNKHTVLFVFKHLTTISKIPTPDQQHPV